MGGVWRQYGRADARWQVRDANVISLEILTVAVIGPLCLYMIFLLRDIQQKRRKNDPTLAITIGNNILICRILCCCMFTLIIIIQYQIQYICIFIYYIHNRVSTYTSNDHMRM